MFPHPKDLSIDANVVTRLRIAPECLVVAAVETAETTTKHGFDNDWDCHTLLFAQNLPFIKSKLTTIISSPNIAIAFNRQRSRMSWPSFDRCDSLVSQNFKSFGDILALKVIWGKT